MDKVKAEKAREHQRELYICFIDYKKTFDCVDHGRLWVTMGGYGSGSTPDSVTEKAVCQPGSDSQDGVWRHRQHSHWERSAIGMYQLTTAIQFLSRKYN